jgi:hypothetical protein
VENEALDVGCTHLVKPTLFAGRHSGASQHAANEALVIRLPVVPSVPIHDLLGDEWTHFCASPSQYVPIWRSPSPCYGQLLCVNAQVVRVAVGLAYRDRGTHAPCEHVCVKLLAVEDKMGKRPSTAFSIRERTAIY